MVPGVSLTRSGRVAEITVGAVLLSVVVFATEIGSNFFIRVRNTIEHEPPQPIREAFSFCFFGYGESRKQKICGTLWKNNGEVGIYMCQNSMQKSMRTTKTIC